MCRRPEGNDLHGHRDSAIFREEDVLRKGRGDDSDGQNAHRKLNQIRAEEPKTTRTVPKGRTPSEPV